MWYIVYKEKFKSYTDTGGGYFVKYKNKIEDEYSPNWFEAQKYKSLGAALTKMGIRITPGMDTLEKFFKGNAVDQKSMMRGKALDTILGEKNNLIVFKKGRIDKIGSNGEFLGDASEEVISFINSQINKNASKNKSKQKKIDKIFEDIGGGNGYLIETKEGEDFWEGF